MESTTTAIPTILEFTFDLADFERQSPEARDLISVIINIVSSAELTPNAIKPINVDPANSSGIVSFFGKTLNALDNRPRQYDELTGWLTAGVASAIIAAAHEASTGELVNADERLRLRHALADFAGLRQTLM